MFDHQGVTLMVAVWLKYAVPMSVFEYVPQRWKDIVLPDVDRYTPLCDFLTQERQSYTVYPPEEKVFSALEMTPPEAVRVVILGQDPYHGPGQAHGLSFSVPEGVALPPSLKNIFKELHADTGLPVPVSGNLEPWAKQGVLLLNAVLTVRAGESNSHRGRGWEALTDAILGFLAQQSQRVVFVLWGAFAQRKMESLDLSRHPVICSSHPSPLSAHQGFLGSKPFSRINATLLEMNATPIDWRL
ncbi:MAG: uracil-DNA glycosylase [Deinococcaceae bacterium]